MIAAQAQKGGDASLAASRMFRGLKPEVERAVRKFEAAQDEKLEAIIGAWGRFEYKIILDNDYAAASGIARGLAYSASDVEGFSIALARIRDGGFYKAGIFISALINNCADNDFIIHTSHLEKPIVLLGFMNTKSITVEGDVADHAGWGMENGSITVKGDVGDNAGNFMKDGRLIIKGNCKGDVGFQMRGGRISVEGDYKGCAGDCMLGGEIRLEGNLGKIGKNIQGGMIFHKGILIAGK